VKSGETQQGQKCRVTGAPLSAALVKLAVLPEAMRNWAATIRRLTLNALPVTRRQSTQWQ